MKTRIPILIGGCVCGLIFTVQSGFAQGSLTPSGPPGPTMITLSQIEPRTIVNAANTPGDTGDSFIISQPGSYYLTGNITGVGSKNGIEIITNNVTLDLNGFTLQGVSGNNAGIGIIFYNQTNIVVRNGTVNGWYYGVYGGNSDNFVVERLNVSFNDVGISIGSGVVRDCNSQYNSSDGIDSNGGIISGCMANYNGGCGIFMEYGTVSGCVANNNGAEGMFMDYGTVSGCTMYYNSYGIIIEAGLVSGCLISYSGLSGVESEGSGCTIIGNTCFANNTDNSTSNAGIYIVGAKNLVEDNNVTYSGNAGILINNNGNYTDNIIIKNSVSGTISGTGNNYVTPNAQIVGPLITTTGIITSTNPWANFSF